MIITLNLSGNIHEACSSIKNKWYAKYLLQMVLVSGNGSIAVFKIPDRADYERLWKEFGYREEGV
jgi:hypothetical protein